MSVEMRQLLRGTLSRHWVAQVSELTDLLTTYLEVAEPARDVKDRPALPVERLYVPCAWLPLGHWALGIGRWALGVERWALGVGHWALGPGPSRAFTSAPFSMK